MAWLCTGTSGPNDRSARTIELSLFELLRVGNSRPRHALRSGTQRSARSAQIHEAFTTTRIPLVSTTVIGVSGGMNSPWVMTSTM